MTSTNYNPSLLASECQTSCSRLGIAPDALYCWISHGHVAARRTAGGRLYVRFTPEVEQTLRQRIANSNRIRLRNQNVSVGDVIRDCSGLPGHRAKGKPRALLGEDTWQKMLEVSEIFERERRECEQLLECVEWVSDVIKPLIAFISLFRRKV